MPNISSLFSATRSAAVILTGSIAAIDSGSLNVDSQIDVAPLIAQAAHLRASYASLGITLSDAEALAVQLDTTLAYIQDINAYATLIGRVRDQSNDVVTALSLDIAASQAAIDATENHGEVLSALVRAIAVNAPMRSQANFAAIDERSYTGIATLVSAAFDDPQQVTA